MSSHNTQSQTPEQEWSKEKQLHPEEVPGRSQSQRELAKSASGMKGVRVWVRARARGKHTERK